MITIRRRGRPMTTAGTGPGASAEVLVALDVGTSGARAAAFDLAGPPGRRGPAALPDGDPAR